MFHAWLKLVSSALLIINFNKKFVFLLYAANKWLYQHDKDNEYQYNPNFFVPHEYIPSKSSYEIPSLFFRQTFYKKMKTGFNYQKKYFQLPLFWVFK